jgi:cysteinyl-tRNA synthetase
MTLRLHDTAARAVRDFVPLSEGRASLYLCGATVQGAPHIGHMRSGVCFDILIRWLQASGYQVTYGRNVTDIDDKILTVAALENVPWWALAERNQRAFTHAYEALGCLPPDVEPHATGHIPEMLRLIDRLIERGHAYAADGSVYFDVSSYPGYGALSGQRTNEERPSETGEEAGKRDPRDFALWKAAKPGEPHWDTPWGQGRPGWHLECSAMSTKYLGPAFDIHGGGIDLIFPHHENEIAQSVSAGDPFARYWLHNGLLGISGAKMSKSVGNSLSVAEMLTKVRPPELRYYLGQAHYRSTLEYSPDALEEASAAYQRIERFVTRANDMAGDRVAEPDTGFPLSFSAALDDDLGVPAALASVHAAVRDGNQALAHGDTDTMAKCLAQVRSMLAVLGLDPLSGTWSGSGRNDRLHFVVDALVGLAVQQRESARARRDYATADSIRDGLEKIGVVVEDTPEGPRWELKR